MQPRAAVLAGSNDAIQAGDYESILETWTHSDTIYAGLDNKATVAATFHSSEFRKAFAVAFPDIYGHGGNITKRELVELSGGVEQYHNFFITLFTPQVRWNDLSRSDSIWRVQLNTSNGVAADPAEILTINIDQNLRSVYSHMTRFDKAYLIRFPLVDTFGNVLIDDTTKEFSLRVASALGVATLTWKLSAPKKTMNHPL